MKRNKKVPVNKCSHFGQIPTNLKTIRTEIFDKGRLATDALLEGLVSEPNSFRQKNLIIAAAMFFERISCLVYFGKGGRCQKPPVSCYYHNMFEPDAESPEEVYNRVNDITEEKAKHIHKLIWQIADIVCPMMAYIGEQAFISEYAYAIEYVIMHNGDLPKPEMETVFPTNYSDYHYEDGIAGEIREYVLI